ncbi:MAG: hypothetical protein IJ333_05080 [Clostridia bacterium]|nr:hypothetical protein [Clostridia bacterium]
MLNSEFDFGLAKHITSKNESDFIELVESKYGILVKETFYTIGRLQNNLRIWADLSRRDTKLSKDLYNIHTNLNGCNLYTSSSKLNTFAKKFIKEYFRCFSIDIEDLSKTTLHIHDYIDSIKNYAYGHAIKNIKQILSQKYCIAPRNIFAFYEPIVTIIGEDEIIYSLLMDHKREIIELCYKEIKCHDYYDVIKKDVIAVNIRLKSTIAPEMLNDYYMKQ